MKHRRGSVLLLSITVLAVLSIGAVAVLRGAWARLQAARQLAAAHGVQVVVAGSMQPPVRATIGEGADVAPAAGEFHGSQVVPEGRNVGVGHGIGHARAGHDTTRR
jgi:hypothetical protein